MRLRRPPGRGETTLSRCQADRRRAQPPTLQHHPQASARRATVGQNPRNAVDVLQRTVDPSYTCKRIHTMLAPDGVCLIVTHNLAGRQGHVYGLSRLYYFTEGTLHALLAKCRLDTIRLDVRGEYGLAGDDCVYAIVKKK